MPIIHIEGPAKTGKSLIANSMRNSHIAQSTAEVRDEAGKLVSPAAIRGALLVDDTQAGEPRHLLEKLIIGDALTQPRPAKEIPWKADPLVIVVGKKAAILDEFEKLAPGFVKMFGPVTKMGTAGA